MEPTIAGGAPPRAGRREWTGLAVLALPTLLLALDFSVLFLALPEIGDDLHPSSVQQLWILDVYGFLTAGFLVTMGTIGDRIGRRRMLMIGAAAFGLLSLLAAYSQSAEMLIAARALMGIAGATLMPSTLALISNMFRDDKQRSTAVGIWATTLTFGIAIGPIVGGALLQTFWWGSVFLIGVPVMAVLLVAAPRLLPEFRTPEAGRIDPLSVVLSLGTILPVIYGLKELAKDGFRAVPVLAVVAGLVLGWLFVHRQRRLTSPLLDLKLFRHRSFSAALGILLLSGAASGGVAFLYIEYLQLVQGFSPLKSGLWLIPYTVGMIAGSMLSPAIAKRVSPGWVTAGGLAIATVGFLLLTQVDANSGVAIAVTGLVIVFFGISPTWVLGTNLVLGSAPPEKAGSASSISETGSELGVALGVAVLGSVSTIVYRHDILDAVPGAPGAARDSLVGAVSVAATLPGDAAGPLLAGARTAYTAGFSVAGAIGAIAAAILAVLAAALLRQIPPTGSDTGAAESIPDGAAAMADGGPSAVDGSSAGADGGPSAVDGNPAGDAAGATRVGAAERS